MSKPQINPGKVPPACAPEVWAGRSDPEKHFTFSLRYWREHEHFGIGNVDTTWLASLLGRLQGLCKEKISRILDDPSYQDSIRYHPIDWDARAIPITLDSIEWLPREIRENPDEFPLFQFHVSKATGRIHGFWDSDWCFQVVLIDPLHNLQPSKDVGYNIRPTKIAGCQYSALRIALDKASEKQCLNTECDFARSMKAAVPNSVDGQFVIMAGVSPDVAEELNKIRQQQTISISEIVEYGITFCNENGMTPQIGTPS